MKQEILQHLKRAEELIDVADENLKNHHPADSVSRSYYSMFHAATAVLMELGIERSSHKGLIAAFGESVIKKGFMDSRYHGHFRRAFEARSESDYMPVPSESAENAETILQQTREFAAACREFIEKRDS